MSLPVVTVAKYGLPVVDVAPGKIGMPVIEATNGRGIPVTKVTNGIGMPVVFEGGGGGGGGDVLGGIGAFTSSAGWTLSGGATISGGVMTFGTGPSSQALCSSPAIPLTAGTYHVTLDFDADLGAGLTVNVGNGSHTFLGGSPGPDTLTADIVVTSGAAISLNGGSGNDGIGIDNFVVTKIA